MANEQNLIPGGHIPSKEEASKGGKRSGETRRKRKTLRETYMDIASLPMITTDTLADQFAARYKELSGEELNVDAAIMLAQIYKASMGDTQAAAFIRDTIGEKNAEVIDTKIKVVLQGGSDDYAG